MPAEIGDLKDDCPLCKVIAKAVRSASSACGNEILDAPHGPWFTVTPLRHRDEADDGSVMQIWTPEPGSRSYQHTSSAKLTPLSNAAANSSQDRLAALYEHLKSLLATCAREHTQCVLQSHHVDSPAVRVIDCKTRTLIPPKDEPYLTLSYVWGSQRSCDPFVDDILYFPATIEDAISATLALNFRYLWVDRFCINQSDQAEVLQQISVMDAIYQKSSLTIIAACGSDAEYGLPGVGVRKRMECYETRSQSHHIREIVNGRRLIASSRWNERGWTYQEGLFAQRQLVFTDYGVYYECAENNAWELDPTPAEPLFTRIAESIEHLSILEILKQYSKRDLSHETDILFAVSGILNALEAHNHDFRHCWGLPIPSIPISSMRDKPLISRPLLVPLIFCLALGWDHEAHLVGTVPRRAGFPSWSWCGWKGQIGTFQELEDDLTRVYRNTFSKTLADDEFLSIRLEKLDGTILDWDQYVDLPPLTRQQQISRFLHITTFTTAVHIRAHQSDRRGLKFVPRITSTMEVVTNYYDVSKLPTEGYILYLPERKLLVGRVDGVYERIALFTDAEERRFRLRMKAVDKEIRCLRLG
ncbi:hypothetical protein ACN47E_003440 [Coniothyrium glycines]